MRLPFHHGLGWNTLRSGPRLLQADVKTIDFGRFSSNARSWLRYFLINLHCEKTPGALRGIISMLVESSRTHHALHYPDSNCLFQWSCAPHFHTLVLDAGFRWSCRWRKKQVRLALDWAWVDLQSLVGRANEKEGLDSAHDIWECGNWPIDSNCRVVCAFVRTLVQRCFNHFKAGSWWASWS